jgi:hypothetical protein
VNLDFLSHQVSLVLDENRAIRAEMRELRDGNVNLGRLLEHIREDVIIAMKTELNAVLAGFEARLESRIADAIDDASRRNGPRE